MNVNRGPQSGEMYIQGDQYLSLQFKVNLFIKLNKSKILCKSTFVEQSLET